MCSLTGPSPQDVWIQGWGRRGRCKTAPTPAPTTYRAEIGCGGPIRPCSAAAVTSRRWDPRAFATSRSRASLRPSRRRRSGSLPSTRRLHLARSRPISSRSSVSCALPSQLRRESASVCGTRATLCLVLYMPISVGNARVDPAHHISWMSSLARAVMMHRPGDGVVRRAPPDRRFTVPRQPIAAIGWRRVSLLLKPPRLLRVDCRLARAVRALNRDDEGVLDGVGTVLPSSAALDSAPRRREDQRR